MIYLHKIWHDDVERVFQVHVHHPLKIIFKIQDGGWPIDLRDMFFIIMRYCNFSTFKTAAVRHLGNLKLKFLTTCTSEFRNTICVSVFNFVEIARMLLQRFRNFSGFSSEM